MEETENEEHFLKYCIAYKYIRKDFTQEIEENDEALNIIEILFDNINKAIRYIRRATARRNRILKMT